MYTLPGLPAGAPRPARVNPNWDKTKATRGALPGLSPFIHQLHQSGISTAGARRYFVIQNPGSGSQNGTAPKVADAILTTTDCEAEAAVGAEAPGCEVHSSPPPLLAKSQGLPRQCSLRFQVCGACAPHHYIHYAYYSAGKTTLSGCYRALYAESGA